jgi:hypothetical protein
MMFSFPEFPLTFNAETLAEKHNIGDVNFPKPPTAREKARKRC